MNSKQMEQVKLKAVIENVATEVILASRSRGKYTHLYLNGKKTEYLLITENKQIKIIKLNESVKDIKDKVSNDFLKKIREIARICECKPYNDGIKDKKSIGFLHILT